MPLGKNATAGDYVKDFRKSKAPQFKGKSKEKKHQMAIAAYLDKRDSQKEAKLAGSTLKLFGQNNRDGSKPELDRDKPTFAKLRKKAIQKKWFGANAICIVWSRVLLRLQMWMLPYISYTP